MRKGYKWNNDKQIWCLNLFKKFINQNNYKNYEDIFNEENYKKFNLEFLNNKHSFAAFKMIGSSICYLYTKDFLKITPYGLTNHNINLLKNFKIIFNLQE